MGPADEIEAALDLGDVRRAAELTARAIGVEPYNQHLYNLAGALLLVGGEPAEAERIWDTVLQWDAGNPMALYGLGVVALARQQADRAHALFSRAAEAGDRGSCHLAVSYVEFLRGRTEAGAMPLPGELSAGPAAMQAVAADRRGDMAAGGAAAQSALSALGGVPYMEPLAPLMGFASGNWIRFSGARIPRGLLSADPSWKRPPLSASASAKLRRVPHGTSGVTLSIDGRTVAAQSGATGSVDWDTRSYPDGPHLVEIAAFDSAGKEIGREQSLVLVRNGAASPPRVRDARLEGVFWRIAGLRPSRALLCMIASRAATAARDPARANRMANLAAAIDPAQPGLPARPVVRDDDPTMLPFWSGPSTRKVVALTFDDGPRPQFTERLLALLAEEKVPATFFVLGRETASAPGIVEALARAGMEIANHSYTHPNLTRMPDNEVLQELLRTSSAIEDATGARPVFFRPPGGNMDDRVRRLAASAGLRACMWTVNGEGKERDGPEALVNLVLGSARPGAVILLHNGREATYTALRRIISGLRGQGYEFVTVSQLAGERR